MRCFQFTGHPHSPWTPHFFSMLLQRSSIYPSFLVKYLHRRHPQRSHSNKFRLPTLFQRYSRAVNRESIENMKQTDLQPSPLNGLTTNFYLVDGLPEHSWPGILRVHISIRPMWNWKDVPDKSTCLVFTDMHQLMTFPWKMMMMDSTRMLIYWEDVTSNSILTQIYTPIKTTFTSISNVEWSKNREGWARHGYHSGSMVNIRDSFSKSSHQQENE